MSGKKVPKIIRLIRQAKGLNADPDDDSLLDKLAPHVPGIVTFADHNRTLPWATEYSTVLMFADVSGFTSLCECYSAMQDSGIDKLTKTLNDYLGAIVEKIIISEGDILKFAGDAILVVWRVNSETELQNTIDRVVQCCLDIQKHYGEWNTDIGITLTVKMGISAGPMKVTFLGNNEFRVYVETGKAVADVNIAESFCQSGYIVLSPDAWSQCSKDTYEFELLQDESHVHIITKKGFQTHDAGRSGFRAAGYATVFSQSRRMSMPPVSAAIPPVENVSTMSSPVLFEESETQPQVSKFSRLSKLRSVVKTVTDMKLDEALRLFILPPVLKKIDDFQPLEYLSEMRQVSIVFVNLVLDQQEDETLLLQKIFDIAHNQIKALHGCLNKVFLFDKGCTFLVIFGLPGFKHEQDCAHALMCSSRMKNKLTDQQGVLHVSIGVTTGKTFCGVVGHSKRHEYSVIGRKVNMAARLMMHYPDKVTCDNNTYQLSRLPPHSFNVLVTKRMKGLKNIGIIREFVESGDLALGVNSVPYFQYPILGCKKEKELFEDQLTKLTEGTGDEEVNHLVYVGASGIGKTRLMDDLIVTAENSSCRIISCGIQMKDRFNSHFITRHIMRMLISMAGFSQHIDKEPRIVERLMSKGIIGSLNLMLHILGVQLSETNIFYKADEIVNKELGKCEELIYNLADLCTQGGISVVIILDDVQNIDTDSWTTLYTLSQIPNILLVLTIRPAAVEEPPCQTATKFFECSNVYIEDIAGLDNRYVTALACQLMDVVMIPIALEKILKEICHGVPYWCEQVLIDMAEKKQLIILEAEDSEYFEETSVAPDAKYLQITRLDSDGSPISYRQSNDMFKRSVTMELLHQSEQPKSHNFLKNLGYVHKQRGQKGGKVQRMAIFSPEINPEEIPLPDIMKNLIIAKIDSMRATEQLIVKCASVLGETFTRDMIESILPRVNRIKARKSFRVLRKTGIFECANLYNPHYSKFSKDTTEEDSALACYCPVFDEDVDRNLCNLMKFTNKTMMDTCYQLLMESQRKALHASSADYLEREADKMRHGIPYYSLERPPPNSDDNIGIDINQSRRRSSIKGEDIYEAKAESYVRNRGRRKGVQIQDVGAILPSLLQSMASDRTTEQACECLLPMYNQIYYHRKATKEYLKIIDVLVEEAAASIIIRQTDNAIKKLEEAEELIDKIIEEEEKDAEDGSLYILYAKLARLTGKALYVSGDKEDAYVYMKHACNLVNASIPEGYCGSNVKLSFLWMFLKFLRYSSKPRRPATEKTLEQGYCLSELYKFEEEKHDVMRMSIITLKQMIKVTGRKSNLHQTIESYRKMIDFCKVNKHRKLKEKLEQEFLVCCLARNEELQSDDLLNMCDICSVICQTSLQKGEAKRSISAGTVVLEIADSMKYTEIDRSVFPIMALNLIFSNNKEACVEVMDKIRAYNMKKYSTLGKTWYHAINMEIMLNWSVSQESFDDSLDFATYIMSKPDAMYNDMLPRYMLSIAIAMWFCRHDQWVKAQIWFDYWEMFELDEINFLSVYILCRKIEIMLVSLSISKVTKPKALWKELQDACVKDIKRLSFAVKKVASLQPRYFHLEAYLLILQHKYCFSRWCLLKAINTAKKQGNKLELNWIRNHKLNWFRRNLGKGNRFHPEWIESFSTAENVYTWPLVAR